MPDLSMIIALTTILASFMGLLLAVNFQERKMRFMGHGMLAGAAGGGLYLGFAVNWAMAAIVLGIGLGAAVILLFLFLSGGSL